MRTIIAWFLSWLFSEKTLIRAFDFKHKEHIKNIQNMMSLVTSVERLKDYLLEDKQLGLDAQKKFVKKVDDEKIQQIVEQEVDRELKEESEQENKGIEWIRK